MLSVRELRGWRWFGREGKACDLIQLAKVNPKLKNVQ